MVEWKEMKMAANLAVMKVGMKAFLSVDSWVAKRVEMMAEGMAGKMVEMMDV